MKIKLFLISALSLFMLGGCFSFIDRKYADVGKEYFMLNGITFGSTEEEVLKAFGKPGEIIPTKAKYSKRSTGGEIFKYDKMEVFIETTRSWFNRKKTWTSVSKVNCRRNDYSAYGGIKAGDSVAKLFKTYPHGEEYVISKKTIIEYPYLKARELRGLRIIVENGIIDEIQLYTYYFGH